MQTERGVSGAPLIMKDDKNVQIIGIHAMKRNGLVGEIKLRMEMFEEIKNNFK